MADMEDHPDQNKEKSQIMFEVQNDVFSQEEITDPLMLDIAESASSTMTVRCSHEAIFEGDDDELLSSSLWTDDKIQHVNNYEEFSVQSDEFEERINITTKQNITEIKDIDEDLNDTDFTLTEVRDMRNEYIINQENHTKDMLSFETDGKCMELSYDDSSDIGSQCDSNKNDNTEFESDFTLRSWSMGEAEEEDYFKDKEFEILSKTNNNKERDSLDSSPIEEVVHHFTEENLLQSAIRDSIFDRSPLSRSPLTPIKEESFDQGNNQIDNVFPECSHDITTQRKLSNNTVNDDFMETNRETLTIENPNLNLISKCIESISKQTKEKDICPELSQIEHSDKRTNAFLEEASITADDKQNMKFPSRCMTYDPIQSKVDSITDSESSYSEHRNDFTATSEEYINKLDVPIESDIPDYHPKIKIKALLISFAVFLLVYNILNTRFPAEVQVPDSRCLEILSDFPSKIQSENENNCAEQWSLDLKMVSGKKNVLWYDTKPKIQLKKTTLYLRNGWQNVFQADDTHQKSVSEHQLGKSIDGELSKLGYVYFNMNNIKNQNILVVATAMDSCGIIKEKEIILFCKMEERRKNTRSNFKVWLSWIFSLIMYILLTDGTYINYMVCLAQCHLQCFFP